MTVIKLREYQKDAVRFTLRVPKSLLCMRVGSGKTICAMFAIRALFRKDLTDKAIVACTKSSVSVFVNDFKEKANIDVSLVEGVDDFLEFLKGPKKVCLIKHSMFEKVGADVIALNKLSTIINKEGIRIALAIDEAHKLQNPDGIAHEAYQRMSFAFQRVILLTATPYSSCLSQFYGLIHLIYPDLWKSMRVFKARFIDEISILDLKTHRVVRKEKVRYKNLKEFRETIEPFTYFYYPPVPLVHIEHHTRLNDYVEYDELCQGILRDEDIEKMENARAKKEAKSDL